MNEGDILISLESYRQGVHDAFEMLGERKDERVMVLMGKKQEQLLQQRRSQWPSGRIELEPKS
jgi:hypothetical protein